MRCVGSRVVACFLTCLIMLFGVLVLVAFESCFCLCFLLNRVFALFWLLYSDCCCFVVVVVCLVFSCVCVVACLFIWYVFCCVLCCCLFVPLQLQDAPTRENGFFVLYIVLFVCGCACLMLVCVFICF